ncbi:MAG: hypothetical protein H0X33_05005 [Taibaiella sp.]|nr:hypothetical protein [Taibaiella sp.]
MKKLTLLMSVLMIAGSTFSYAGHGSCCKKGGAKCEKDAKCCKDKKHCSKECDKDKKEAEKKS